MIPLSQSQGIHYGLLEHADVDEMSELISGVFSRSEPMAVAAGVTYEDLLALTRLYGRRAPGDGLTVIARDGASGRLVGAMLTDDFASPPPDTPHPLPRHFDPVVALLEELDGKFRKLHAAARGDTLHIFMMGVDPGSGGKGIARSLVELTLENGRRKGYQRAITEATGKVSQHIFRGHGFLEQCRTSYRDFVYQGNHPFASAVDHEAVILMARDLTT